MSAVGCVSQTVHLRHSIRERFCQIYPAEIAARCDHIVRPGTNQRSIDATPRAILNVNCQGSEMSRHSRSPIQSVGKIL